MATFGGTGAKALKEGINNIFAENDLLHCWPVLILARKLRL